MNLKISDEFDEFITKFITNLLTVLKVITNFQIRHYSKFITIILAVLKFITKISSTNRAIAFWIWPVQHTPF